METKFKDVAHLYIGCELAIEDSERKCKLAGINYSDGFSINDEYNFRFKKYFPFKPLLRPLLDMTKEERDYVFSFEKGYDELKFIESLSVDAKITSYLLSKGFDLFGLIESGEAIDLTKTRIT